MRYAPGHKERTRTKILQAAGRVFRREGYHAAGVDAVMEEAGLTAGGFYAHFESKQALLAEALGHAGADARDRTVATLDGLEGRAWVDAFVERYLSSSHCGGLESGCPLVALVSEVARSEPAVKMRFEAMVRDLAGALAANARGAPADAAQERALAALALCVGGLGLARSVADERFAEQILAGCRNQARRVLTGRVQPPRRRRVRRGTDRR